MKALLPARRAVKALDQVALGETPNGYYIPIETLSSWASSMSAPDAAVNVATVLTCVRVLAESFASVPLLMYRRLPDGGRERAIDHPLYPVLHQQPNPDMTSFVWRELVMSHLATWGNAYNEKAYDGLGRLQLWPIRPDRMTPRYAADGTKEFEYVGTNGVRRVIPADRIFHLQGLGSNGLAGYSPIALLRSSLSLLRTAETFGQTIFDNNARPATVLQHPKTMSQGAIDRLTAQMDGLKGSRNNGKTVLLEEGTTVQPIGFPPEDAQFLETRVFQKREILAAYRIPPHMAGDLERATFSNIEQQSIEFRTYTMLPWYVRAEQDISAQLLAEDERDTFYAEFLADGLLRADAKSRAEALAIRWQNGTLSQDDWRALENENPLPDGMGQHYFVPVNYQPIDKAIAPPEPVAPPADIPSIPDILANAAKSSQSEIVRLAEESIAAQERMTERMAGAMATAMKSQAERPINVDATTAVHVDPGAVVVNVPEQPAPVVNVPGPEPQRTVRKTVERDEAGRLVSVIEEPV